jgi:hypothetical protein
MTVYGIASAISGDMQDFYASRDEAEAVLAAILRDVPEFESELWVEPLMFELSVN